jgi:hypothetical protein
LQDAQRFANPLEHVVGRSRYAAEKKSKIVYTPFTCPIPGIYKKGVYHEPNRSKSI